MKILWEKKKTSDTKLLSNFKFFNVLLYKLSFKNTFLISMINVNFN